MSHGFYRSVYFTLKDPEDVRLLGLILALPPSRQSRILKATLQDALPRYLRRHHPEIVPLSAKAVAAAVQRIQRPPRHQSQATQLPSDKARRLPLPLPAPPDRDDGHQLPSELTPPVPPHPSETEHRQEAERKLDRLLRTLAK